MLTRHLDEARKAAIKLLHQLLIEKSSIERAVLIEDLFGKLRLVLWTHGPVDADLEREINERFADSEEGATPYWTSEIWMASQAADNSADRELYDQIWEEARPEEGLGERLRIADRHRTRGAWLRDMTEPPWQWTGERGQSPPILVFYSFKGGVGRSTALASFAIQRTRAGERVVVIDFDLDAPGIGVLLAADSSGTTASWGAIDYLLERPYDSVDLRGYYHACRQSTVTQSGEILVFPAGKMNSDYLGKLARIDFELPVGDAVSPFVKLLHQVRDELHPDWILLDTRTGLSESSGMLLGGLAHLHVLFGTSSEQSWQGLQVIIDRLGADRVLEDKPQLECLLVQSLVPQDTKAAKSATAGFADRARDEFSEHYYAADPEGAEEDTLWYIRDLEDDDAPHVPVAISYEPKLAHFDSIEDVADHLAKSPEYRLFADRIAARFMREEE
jgi:hypothetical protein